MNREQLVKRLRTLVEGDNSFDMRVGAPSALRDIEAPLPRSISIKVCVGVQIKRDGAALSITRVDASYQCIVVPGVHGLITPFTLKTLCRSNLTREAVLAYGEGLITDVFDHGKFVVTDVATLSSDMRKMRNTIRRIDEPSTVLCSEIVEFVRDHGTRLEFIQHAETVLCLMMLGAMSPTQYTFCPGDIDNFYHMYRGFVGLRTMLKDVMRVRWTPEVDRDTFVSIVNREAVTEALVPLTAE